MYVDRSRRALITYSTSIWVDPTLIYMLLARIKPNTTGFADQRGRPRERFPIFSFHWYDSRISCMPMRSAGARKTNQPGYIRMGTSSQSRGVVALWRTFAFKTCVEDPLLEAGLRNRPLLHAEPACLRREDDMSSALGRGLIITLQKALRQHTVWDLRLILLQFSALTAVQERQLFAQERAHGREHPSASSGSPSYQH